MWRACEEADRWEEEEEEEKMQPHIKKYRAYNKSVVIIAATFTYERTYTHTYALPYRIQHGGVAATHKVAGTCGGEK